MHFNYSHRARMESVIAINFLLRALRMCDKDYIKEEIGDIFKTYERLRHPRVFLINQRQKAERIRKRNSENASDRNRRRHEKTKRWITIPNSKKAVTISQTLEKTDIKQRRTLESKFKKF